MAPDQNTGSLARSRSKTLAEVHKHSEQLVSRASEELERLRKKTGKAGKPVATKRFEPKALPAREAHAPVKAAAARKSPSPSASRSNSATEYAAVSTGSYTVQRASSTMQSRQGPPSNIAVEAAVDAQAPTLLGPPGSTKVALRRTVSSATSSGHSRTASRQSSEASNVQRLKAWFEGISPVTTPPGTPPHTSPRGTSIDTPSARGTPPDTPPGSSPRGTQSPGQRAVENAGAGTVEGAVFTAASAARPRHISCESDEFTRVVAAEDGDPGPSSGRGPRTSWLLSDMEDELLQDDDAPGNMQPVDHVEEATEEEPPYQSSTYLQHTALQAEADEHRDLQPEQSRVFAADATAAGQDPATATAITKAAVQGNAAAVVVGREHAAKAVESDITPAASWQHAYPSSSSVPAALLDTDSLMQPPRPSAQAAQGGLRRNNSLGKPPKHPKSPGGGPAGAVGNPSMPSSAAGRCLVPAGGPAPESSSSGQLQTINPALLTSYDSYATVVHKKTVSGESGISLGSLPSYPHSRDNSMGQTHGPPPLGAPQNDSRRSSISLQSGFSENSALSMGSHLSKASKDSKRSNVSAASVVSRASKESAKSQGSMFSRLLGKKPKAPKQQPVTVELRPARQPVFGIREPATPHKVPASAKPRGLASRAAPATAKAPVTPKQAVARPTPAKGPVANTRAAANATGSPKSPNLVKRTLQPIKTSVKVGTPKVAARAPVAGPANGLKGAPGTPVRTPARTPARTPPAASARQPASMTGSARAPTIAGTRAHMPAGTPPRAAAKGAAASVRGHVKGPSAAGSRDPGVQGSMSRVGPTAMAAAAAGADTAVRRGSRTATTANVEPVLTREASAASSGARRGHSRQGSLSGSQEVAGPLSERPDGQQRDDRPGWNGNTCIRASTFDDLRSQYRWKEQLVVNFSHRTSPSTSRQRSVMHSRDGSMRDATEGDAAVAHAMDSDARLGVLRHPRLADVQTVDGDQDPPTPTWAGSPKLLSPHAREAAAASQSPRGEGFQTPTSPLTTAPRDRHDILGNSMNDDYSDDDDDDDDDVVDDDEEFSNDDADGASVDREQGAYSEADDGVEGAYEEDFDGLIESMDSEEMSEQATPLARARMAAKRAESAGNATPTSLKRDAAIDGATSSSTPMKSQPTTPRADVDPASPGPSQVGPLISTGSPASSRGGVGDQTEQLWGVDIPDCESAAGTPMAGRGVANARTPRRALEITGSLGAFHTDVTGVDSIGAGGVTEGPSPSAQATSSMDKEEAASPGPLRSPSRFGRTDSTAGLAVTSSTSDFYDLVLEKERSQNLQEAMEAHVRTPQAAQGLSPTAQEVSSPSRPVLRIVADARGASHARIPSQSLMPIPETGLEGHLDPQPLTPKSTPGAVTVSMGASKTYPSVTAAKPKPRGARAVLRELLGGSGKSKGAAQDVRGQVGPGGPPPEMGQLAAGAKGGERQVAVGPASASAGAAQGKGAVPGTPPAKPSKLKSFLKVFNRNSSST